MLWYVIRRLVLVIPTLVGVAIAVFFLIRVMPGDVVVVKLRADGAAVSEETIQAERKRLGLDKPLYEQFIDYMVGLPRLDLGKSLWTGEPVIKEIALRMPVSFQIAIMAGVMRSPLLVLMREDYIRTARAKGVWTRLIMSRHALRNALLPVVTVIGLEFAFLIGGLVVTEQVFNINGIGKLFVDATARGDFNLIQGLVLLIATIFIFVNLLVDLLYGWLDPRIRLT